MMMSDLPPNVTRMKDRHGKIRYRFRRSGFKSVYLPGQPGDAAFHAKYAEIVAEGPQKRKEAHSQVKVAPRSLDDLLRLLKRSPEWKQKASTTQRQQSLVYQRFMDRVSAKGNRYGDRPVERVTFSWLQTILGDMHETPGAANDLRKKLAVLLEYGVRLGWIERNPVRGIKPYKTKKGYHSWTDAEIAQYRTCHPIGTMARFAMELALNTAGRRGNIATLSREDIVDGRIITAHIKGGNVASVPMLSTTRAAMEALPAAPIRHLILTSRGKPYAVASFGNKFREWCNEAGLPHCSIHGLRKAMARMIAESGGSDAEGQAVTGHKDSAMFRYYRAAADREALADRALSNLDFPPQISLSNPKGKD